MPMNSTVVHFVLVQIIPAGEGYANLVSDRRRSAKGKGHDLKLKSKFT
jgi:hypothetical protein